MGNSDGNVTFSLLRVAQYLKDNRLAAKGFDKLAVPSDVAVCGMAYNNVHLNQGGNEITNRILVAGESNFSVSLNYQTIAYGYLRNTFHSWK